jgi:predicted metal-dependent enzyme (double-stranded beta helix superfamily)
MTRMKASKIAYKPVGLALGAVSGVIAGAVFKQAWKMLGHDQDAPDATDEERTWSEVLLAATLQGAIFAGVKATVDRAGATAIQRLTGTWPG